MNFLEHYQKLKIAVASGLFLLITGVLLNALAYYVSLDSMYMTFGVFTVLFGLTIMWYRILHRLHRVLLIIRYKQAKNE